MASPAPQCPQRQRPGGPGEPQQQARQAARFLFKVGPKDAPLPQTQLPGKPCGCQRQYQQAQGCPACHGCLGLCLVCRPQAQQRATRAIEHRQDRRTAEHQSGQAQCDCQPGPPALAWHGRQPIEDQRCAAKLCEIGRSLMGGLGQSQAGEQCEQTAVGDSARVVGGRCFAAKRKRHGLRTRAARQGVNAPPGGPQGQNQQQCEGNARRKNGRQQALRELHGPGAQPVGQQAVRFRRQAAQQGREPRRMLARQLQHVAVGSDVGAAPGVAADEARQYVGRAQKQQSPARQGPHGAVGNDGGGGLVHAKSGCRVAAKHTGKQKGSAVSRAASGLVRGHWR